ncbi:hypothetical protein A0H81_04569 [Grifola frondosa]|uniref:Uncharacterized protein n=1 Tax=Grifola frondosa TaxID=5627 RepID=A0A1C7MFQ6_GRIFR|nr:hypothetical protein A0H81_04569 [Grifola frondosa]
MTEEESAGLALIYSLHHVADTFDCSQLSAGHLSSSLSSTSPKYVVNRIGHVRQRYAKCTRSCADPEIVPILSHSAYFALRAFSWLPIPEDISVIQFHSAQSLPERLNFDSPLRDPMRRWKHLSHHVSAGTALSGRAASEGSTWKVAMKPVSNSPIL